MIKKYEYKFIEIPRAFWTSKPKDDYKTIISAQAAEGWRFVQIHTTYNFTSDSIDGYQLIFEREV